MAHAHNLINTMSLVGYSFSDMLPAYPGRDQTYLDHIWQDMAHASDRFVLPYGVLGTQVCSSRYFNIHPAGFRSNGSHQPWPPNPNVTNVFFFGGSSTIGYGVEDSDTVPAHLQRELETSGHSFQVYNFGAGSYASRHEALRFLDLLDQDLKPDFAVFLDGLNDSVFGLGHRALVILQNNLFQHEKRRRGSSWLRSIIDFAATSFSERRTPYAFDAPVVREIEDSGIDAYLTDAGIADALRKSTASEESEDIGESGARLAHRVWNGYLDSVALIRSLSVRRQIKTIFAWQPVPWFKATSEQRIMERLYKVYRVTAFCSPVYHWLHTQKFPGMADSPDFINLSGVGEGIIGKLYVDYAHYSPQFCQSIASSLAEDLLARFQRLDGAEPKSNYSLERTIL